MNNDLSDSLFASNIELALLSEHFHHCSDAVAWIATTAHSTRK